jgi:hypothetical protein
MQNLLMKEGELSENKEIKRPQLSLWSRLGPSLLLGAFAVFLFKCAPLYTPLTLAAFLGYAATRLWKKWGLYLSLAALIGVSIFLLRTGHEALWTTILSTSIAVSWLLIYLGGQESQALADDWEEKMQTLEKQRQLLEKQCRDIGLKLKEEQRQCLAESQRANSLSAELSFVTSQARESLEHLERQRLHLSKEHQALSVEILVDQQKNAALQLALDHASAQLIELEQKLGALIYVEDESPVDEEEVSLEQVQQQYALLREQFEEKSVALDQARKELFRVENEFLSSQKTWEERELAPSDEVQAFCRDLQALESESRELEAHIATLQEFISSLLEPKKRPRAKKGKALEGEQEFLPELLQNKIDQSVL